MENPHCQIYKYYHQCIGNNTEDFQYKQANLAHKIQQNIDYCGITHGNPILLFVYHI